jgi:hypothetical protein
MMVKILTSLISLVSPFGTPFSPFFEVHISMNVVKYYDYRKVANVKGMFNNEIDDKIKLFQASSKTNATIIFGDDGLRKLIIDKDVEAEFFPGFLSHCEL